MREGPLLKTVWNTLSFNVLLTDTGNDLRNVDEGPLRTWWWKKDNLVLVKCEYGTSSSDNPIATVIGQNCTYLPSPWLLHCLFRREMPELIYQRDHEPCSTPCSPVVRKIRS